MRNLLYKLAFCFFLLFWFFSLLSQSYDNYTTLTTEDGLFHNEITVFFMDSRGLMWIGTKGGLSRYDGVEIENFYHLAGDSSSISGNLIKDIVEDNNGNIWIAIKGGGVSCFDPKSATFTNYQYDDEQTNSLPNNLINSLFIDKEHKLWMGFEENFIAKMDLETRIIQSYEIARAKDYHPERGKDIYLNFSPDKEEENIIWINGLAGLYNFNKVTEHFRHFPYNHKYYFITMDMLIDQEEQIWMGTWSHGLAKFNKKSTSFEYFPPVPEKFYPLPSYSTNIVLDVAEKSKDELWVAGMAFGVGIFNKKTEKFSLLDFQKENETINSTNRINIVYTDKDNRLWLGNNDKGAIIIDPRTQFFTYQEIQGQEVVIQKGVLEPQDFIVDPTNGHLYIATFMGDGLFEFDENRQFLRSIQSDFVIAPIYRYSYKDLFLDSRDQIWALDVSHHTLLKLNKEKGVLETVKHPELFDLINAGDENLLVEIAEDKQGDLWILTSGNGLICYQPKTDKLIKYYDCSSNNADFKAILEYQDFEKDQQDNFWVIGKNAGLYFFNQLEKKFYAANELGIERLKENLPKILTSIAIDSSQNLWVGSELAGIFKIDLQQKTIQNFGYQEGLPNLHIQKIVCHPDGQIWATTTNGLIRYIDQTTTFESFGKKEGIKNPNLDYSLSITHDSTIYFGQNMGFYHFKTSNLNTNKNKPQLVFKDLKILGKEKKLATSLNYLKQLTLPYQENFFSISFAALNYTQPEQNEYAYQLVGYDPDWNYIGNQNVANYTNVPEGNYIFKVKAANNDGVWNEDGIQLTINVLPPWYRSWWAYLSYALLTLGVIFWIYNFQQKRWAIKTQLQLEKAEAERLKELDGLKTQLYTNLTHEFRTPLTVIMGMAEKLKGTNGINLDERFRLIRKNSTQLLNLINQLLDLSKLQAGALTLNYIQSDIIAYLRYLIYVHESLALTQYKKLNFQSSIQALTMDFEEAQLQRIITNLLSNAIKFTPTNGQITLLVEKDEFTNCLIIKVKDTGIGMAATELTHIFDRFYQVDNSATRKQEGTGIGLSLVKELVELMDGKIKVESQIDIGTTFILALPIRQSAPMTELNFSLATHVADESQQPSKIAVFAPKKEHLPQLLIIEDNADVVTYLKSCLYGDYQFLVADDGADGIEKAIENVPDIIITDVMMPEKDGFEVCHHLKTTETTSHIPIIMLTAKASVADRLEGLRQGADAYLAKPFLKEELLIRLAQLLFLRQKMQTYYGENVAINEKSNSFPKENEFIQKVNAIIEENLSKEQFKTSQLCEALFYSKMQVHRKLKALTGKNTSQYLRQYRLRKAKRLLENGSQTISEIAYATGFSSVQYFSRSFKELFEKNPSEINKSP